MAVSAVEKAILDIGDFRSMVRGSYSRRRLTELETRVHTDFLRVQVANNAAESCDGYPETKKLGKALQAALGILCHRVQQMRGALKSFPRERVCFSKRFVRMLDLISLDPFFFTVSQKVIGSGGSSEVKEGWLMRKRICVKMFCETAYGKGVRREVEILSILNHPNVMHMYFGGKNGLAVERAETTLLRLSKPIKQRTLVRVARDVAKALCYLHSMGIVHRDIKPSNILVKDSGRAQVCDFGTWMKAGRKTHRIVGTHGFMPPEILTAKCRVAPAMDMWSFGVMILLLSSENRTLSGEVPGTPACDFWLLRAEQDAIHKIVAARMPADSPLSPVVRECLSLNPKARPSASVVAHFLENF
ncbi:MAG: Serine/threonine-protein kinase PknD [Chlamydiia bacterium]|nr:Serine/threonine-protein kinase PknD [Chlamydiia bacterium]MCH9615001.1 Serine/threonine-protein kinase PknD [Chlamydiia bacterium]MCH9629949.1 Serine/threonine-protein kinase PknD [Chlamydiia bacterium]